ncbi:glycosyl transferase group 1 [Halothece sp. PCC 7418]|uniref:glycosyltransferase n=1 Tax=Halothece sp. (strain PCC 7418) TaxID=65093 RepID=UPI0002A06F6F|nr:glycosyltransferase [Halothece sp. PCC 7418]AFZ44692.1 glycosyl transferase group 1 [Halothece sp. PCC 7418]
MSQKPSVIGYLLKTFPKLSETFILNEMLELERQGIALHIFSLRKPQDTDYHPQVSELQAPVTYVPSLLPDYDQAEETALLENYLAWQQSDPEPCLEQLRFYIDRPEKKRLNELLQGAYLATILPELGIAHLHVHFANIPTATAEIAHHLSGIPYSMTAHAKDIYLTDPIALDRGMKSAEFVLTCTDYNRRYLASISTSSTPIYLSYHGLDLKRFQGEQTPLSVKTEPLKILSIGRFCEKKGFPDLLAACAHLSLAGVPFTCKIVGFGPLQEALALQIKDFNLQDQVTLVGKLTQDQVIEQYRQADVFVLPCQVTGDGDRDGIPNVLIEAMAMELPVISTRISGITELIVSGENGILVPEKDPSAIAQALIQLHPDPKKRSELGRAGRQTVREHFTLETNIAQVKALLLQTLTRHSASPVNLSSSWEAIAS